TTQIASTLNEALQPRGVAVVMEAIHLCMLMRGVGKQNSKAITSAMLGTVRERPGTRGEVMGLIKSGRGGPDLAPWRGPPPGAGVRGGAAPGAGRGMAPGAGRAGAGEPAGGARGAGPRQELAATAATIRESGGTALAIPTDVTQDGAVEAMVEQTVAELGRVDILVTAAGVASFGPVVGTKPSDWDALLAVNLRAVMVCCRAVLPAMIRQRRGTIINIASVAAQRAIPGAAVYTATKAGVVGFSRVLAEELRADRVRVGVLVPGAVDT